MISKFVYKFSYAFFIFFGYLTEFEPYIVPAAVMDMVRTGAFLDSNNFSPGFYRVLSMRQAYLKIYRTCPEHPLIRQWDRAETDPPLTYIYGMGFVYALPRT